MPIMQSYSVLTALHDSVFRFSVHLEPVSKFPESPILQNVAWEKIAVHRDAQGMLRAQKKALRFIFDPPTGNFRVSGQSGEIISGSIVIEQGSKASLQIGIQVTDIIYGFGAATGFPNRNNQQFELMNLDTLFYSVKGASYSTFPFFIIRRQRDFIGIFAHILLPMKVSIYGSESNPGGPSIQMELAANERSVPIDVMLFSGTLPEILNKYSDITGKAFLPPVWSLGYHQSRWSYKTADRVLELAKRFREEEIPCDAIHLDIHYMNDYDVFTWHPDRFPDPEELHRKLAEMGMRTVAIVDPGVHVKDGYTVYEDGKSGRYFCVKANGDPYLGKVWPGKTAFVDFTNENARKWWSQCHEPLFRAGVSGIWNDMNDPVLRVGKKIDVLSQDIRHSTGSHAENRNIYANLEADASCGAFKKFRPDERSFVLTRSAFCGIQKHAAVWTGDNYSSWEQLRDNLNMVINLGLSGVPFSGADVGGFGGRRGLTGMVKLFKNKELFARWMELGSLMPFFRAHTVLYSPDQEPWSFGPEVLESSKKHIRRRYRLLPYIYGLMWQSVKTLAPIVRPVFYEFPEIPESPADQFFLGPCLMAAPILSPGVTSRTVYLPPGDWYEYETGKKHSGPAKLEFNIRPGSYPLFVRAGSILPVCRALQNAQASMESELILEIYPDTTIKGFVHLDDGTSLKALQGDYYEQEIDGKRDRSGNITLTMNVLKKKFAPKYKTIKLRLPVQYRYMMLRGKKVDGTAVDLSREDRKFTMQSFEIPLTVPKVEFTYRTAWP